jgi:magnesium-transporting ATPase (P-type)
LLLNAAVGAIQEFRAQRSLEALQRMASPSASVLRDGQTVTLPEKKLVVGDIVLLETGSITPADMRLIMVEELQVNESSITGESESIIKQQTKLKDNKLFTGDQTNCVFKGSLITHGRATGVVFATGLNTEMALFEFAKNSGFDKDKILQHMPRNAAIAFDSQRKVMTTLHSNSPNIVAYVKGATEKVLASCIKTQQGSEQIDLNKTQILANAEQLANDGYRVLALAKRHFESMPEEIDADTIERDLIFLGLVALTDPLRTEVPQAMADCISAGIIPVIITGDHRGTALAIAKRLHIAKGEPKMLDGKELELISHQE